MASFVRRWLTTFIAASMSALVFADGVSDADVETAQEELDASGYSNDDLRDKYYNHCDLVFHCVTTKGLWITSEETTEFNDERFTFALKGGELLVPKKRTVLGDGTANYDLTNGGCNKTDGKLMDNILGSPWFKAEMFDDKWVEYRDGRMYGVDAQGDSVTSRTVIWYAECENFD